MRIWRLPDEARKAENPLKVKIIPLHFGCNSSEEGCLASKMLVIWVRLNTCGLEFLVQAESCQQLQRKDTVNLLAWSHNIKHHCFLSKLKVNTDEQVQVYLKIRLVFLNIYNKQSLIRTAHSWFELLPSYHWTLLLYTLFFFLGYFL